MVAFSVSVLGTGLMGSAVARALCNAGCHVTVWNRTRSKAEALAEFGVSIAQSPAAAVAAGHHLVIANVNNCNDLLHLLSDPAVDLGGRHFLNLVTGTPNEIRTLESFIEQCGATFLSGVVMCFPEAVGTPESQIICSGRTESWTRAEPIIKLIAPASSHTGNPATRIHSIEMAVVGCLFWTSLAAFLEGAAFAAREGVDIGDLADFVPATLAGIEVEIRALTAKIRAGDFSAEKVSVATLNDNFRVYREALSNAGASDDLLAAVHGKIARAVAAGSEQDSIATLFRQ